MATILQIITEDEERHLAPGEYEEEPLGDGGSSSYNGPAGTQTAAPFPKERMNDP